MPFWHSTIVQHCGLLKKTLYIGLLSSLSNIRTFMRPSIPVPDLIVCVCMDVSIYRFDLSKANLNDANLEKMNPADIPDVVRGDAFHVYFCC